MFWICELEYLYDYHVLHENILSPSSSSNNFFLADRPSDALLLKQMPKKQTGFVLVIKQNKPDLFFLIEN